MSTFQRIAVFQAITSSGDITLIRPLTDSASDDTIYLSHALPISSNELNKCTHIQIRVGSENISCIKADYDSTAKTMSNCVRGVETYGGDVTVQNIGLIESHNATAKVSCPVSGQNMVQVQEVIQGERNISPKLGAAPTWDITKPNVALTIPHYVDLATGEANITNPEDGMSFWDDSAGLEVKRSGGAWGNPTGIATPNASETVAGKVEIATLSEQGSHTEIGGTGAILALQSKNTIKTPETYTPAFLTGGTIAHSNYALWAAITDGSLRMGLDGVTYNFDGINFGSFNTPLAVDHATSNLSTNGIFDTTIKMQSFTIDAFTTKLNKIILKMGRGGSAPAGNIVLELKAVDGGGLPTGSPLGSVTVSASAITSSTPAEITFQFSSNITVTPSTQYCYVLSAASCTIANYIEVHGDSVNKYSGGIQKSSNDNGSTWGTESGNDQFFKIYSYEYTGVNSMDDVALFIQNKIRAITGGLQTVIFSTNKFIVSSVITTSSSAITVVSTSTGTVGTDISGAGASDWMDCDTGNGTVTNKFLNQAADENKTPVLNASGKLDPKIIDVSESSLASMATKTFLSLDDTPDSRSGKSLNVLRCNAGETADEYWNIPNITFVAGTNIFASADTERNTMSTSYTKVKEIKIQHAGTYTIAFEFKGVNYAGTKAAIYKNGTLYGTEYDENSGSYVAFSDNLAFAEDDLVQLYIKSGNGSFSVYAKNFKIKGQSYIYPDSSVITN